MFKIIKCSIHTIYTWKENSSKAEVSYHTCRDFQTDIITPAGISRQTSSHLPGFPDRSYHTCWDFQTDVITPVGISSLILICTTHWALKLGENFEMYYNLLIFNFLLGHIMKTNVDLGLTNSIQL